MNDFERALADALKKASDDYRPTDQYAAKERFLHRLHRRQLFFATGGVALAGAAAVVAGFLFFARDAAPERAEPLPPAAVITEELPDIAVGERPSGVAYGDDSVWVANSGDGTVMVIDPASREVVATVEVGGFPDDVAVGVGAAWVSDSGAGTIARIPLPSSGEPLDPVVFEVGEPGSTHMDVAPGVDGLWVAKDDSVFRIDPVTNDVQPVATTVESPTDIAVGEGAVYVLGENEVARVDPVSLTATHLADVVPSANQDMGFDDGFLWIANGDAGEVTRVDPTGDTSAPIFVGGNFSGISVDEDAVWVISGGASDVGVLTRIDPDTLAVLEPRAELFGRPYDVTTGGGLVWIANQSAGTVSGLHPDALPGGTDDGPTEIDGQLVFVFGADGDIWAALEDGSLVPLLETPERESDPSLSADGSQLAFARGPTPGGTRVIVMDLASGTETDLGPGGSPRFASDGRLSWVRTEGENDERLAIGVPAEEPRLLEPIPGYGTPIAVRSLSWDLDERLVYYNAGWNESLLMQASVAGDQLPFEIIPINHQTGAYYEQPSVRRENVVHVLRICCVEKASDEATTIELGQIRFGEGGAAYEPVADLRRLLPEVEWIPYGGLDSAGNLELQVADRDMRWRHTVVRSWFVATNSRILLVTAKGEVTDVTAAFAGAGFDFEQIEGLETAPEFDD